MTDRFEKGFTLMELMLATAIMAIVVITMVRLFSPMITYFQRSPARQQANLQARQCMETIERVLAGGKASTLTIHTPPTTPFVPNSQAEFISADGSPCTITWSTSPMNSVHLIQMPPGGTIATDTILATNVTALSFSVDYRDLAMVYVTFQMTAPMDSSGSPNSFFTIVLPNQAVHMLSS